MAEGIFCDGAVRKVTTVVVLEPFSPDRLREEGVDVHLVELFDLAYKTPCLILGVLRCLWRHIHELGAGRETFPFLLLPVGPRSHEERARD